MSTAATVISQQQRTDLILAYLPRVRWIARRIHTQLLQDIALEDLVSVGVLGLIAAIDKFDPRHNAKLTTYADYRIRGSILDSIRSLDGVPAHKRPKMKRIQKAAAAASQRLNDSPDQEQIAAELGIPVDVYHDWLFEVRPNSVSSLDHSFTVGSQTVKLADILADDSRREPDHALEQVQLRQLVDRALASLPQAEFRVMQLYYREGFRISEIAQILQVHSSRIWQMKNKGTARVRDYIYDRWTIARGRKASSRTATTGAICCRG